MDVRMRKWADDRGYQIAWGSAETVERARTAVVVRRESGELDAAFYDDHIEELLDSDGSPRGETVIAVAVPRPAHRVAFEIGGSRFDALLPPTYVRYRETFEEVRKDLAANVLAGAHVERLVAPIKTVAAMLGLVRYGRNNITYAEGIGSYLQLCGYVTDAKLVIPEDAPARRPQLLPECDGCTICRATCPTRAIEEDRVLIRAERCITLANENPGEWPTFVPPRAHHCLLGCLRCQRSCPANSKLEIADSGVFFSADETARLFDGDGPADDKTENGIHAKLVRLDQVNARPVLGRNLRTLLDARRAVDKRTGRDCNVECR
jgi:epoxyqueuosine reductase